MAIHEGKETDTLLVSKHLLALGVRPYPNVDLIYKERPWEHTVSYGYIGVGDLPVPGILHRLPIKHERAEDDAGQEIYDQEDSPYDQHPITFLMIGFHCSCAPY